VVTDLAHGNLPMADSFLPSKSAEGKASISVSDVMGLSGGTVSRVARIPCRALPIKAPPSPGDWLFDLFK
jgi:hypothetical protein